MPLHELHNVAVQESHVWRNAVSLIVLTDATPS